ncbi:hypothetical protein ACO0SA_001176 [Hanseniaspora valbyensis]
MLSSFASTLSSAAASSSSYKIDANYTYGNVIMSNYLQFWQIYEAVSKKTNMKVSIFKFDKKKFEMYINNKIIIKEAYSKITSDIANLQKIKHPNFLNVIEPLESHSKSFIFVTEFISSNLRIKYGNDTMYTMGKKNDKTSDSIVFKKGLYELSQALDFVHNKMSKVILNLNPDTIFINSKGNWKIGSLAQVMPKTDTYYDLNYNNDYNYGSNINYMAPELIFENKFNYTSDYFSLGLLVYFLIYGTDLIKTENQSIEIYKLEYRKLESKILKIGYKNLFPLLIMNDTDYFFIRFLTNVMNRDYNMRCNSLIDWINDEFNTDNGSKDNELIKTLLFIEKGEFHSVNSNSQTVFLNGLTKIWVEFNHYIILNQVVALLLEIVTLKLAIKQKDDADLDLLKLAVNLLLDISDKVLTKDEFTVNIYKELIFEKLIVINPIFEMFLQRIEIFQAKLDPSDFVSLLNSLFLKKLSNNITIQQAILSKNFISSLVKCNDFELTKNFTNPILLKIFSATQSLKIKLACLDVISELVTTEKINKYQMNDSILSILENNKTNNERITLSILQLLTKLVQSKDFYHDDKTVLLDRILPLLWKLSMTEGMDLSSFNKFQNIINYSTRRIQELQIEFIKAQGGNSRNTTPEINGRHGVENSFNQIVQQVDISKSTNTFNTLEKKQLEKLNTSAQVMTPKTERASNGHSFNSNANKSISPMQPKTFSTSQVLTPKTERSFNGNSFKSNGNRTFSPKNCGTFSSSSAVNPKTENPNTFNSLKNNVDRSITSPVLIPKMKNSSLGSSGSMSILQPKVKK